MPHQFFSDNGTGVMNAESNTYDDTSGDRDERGTAFVPPYDYALDPADAVPSLVQASVGPQ